jgi:hypothetical protein
MRLTLFALCGLLANPAAHGQSSPYPAPSRFVAIEKKLTTLQRSSCAIELQQSKIDGVMHSTEAAIVEATKAVSINSNDGNALLCRAEAWVMRAEVLDEPWHKARMRCKLQAGAPGATKETYSVCMGSESLMLRRGQGLIPQPGAAAGAGDIDRARTIDSVVRLLGLLIESIKADEAVFTAGADLDRAIQAKAKPAEVASVSARLQALKLQLAEK